VILPLFFRIQDVWTYKTMITLVSSDNVAIPVGKYDRTSPYSLWAVGFWRTFAERDVGECSMLIKDMMKDLELAENQPIPIPNVSETHKYFS